MAAWSLFSKLKDGLSGADGPPKLETYALHLYGKLPIYKDFISSGFTEEGAKDFRDWLGNGFSRRWSAPRGVQGDRDPPPHVPLRPSRREAHRSPGPSGEATTRGACGSSPSRSSPSSRREGRPSDPFVALSFLEVFEQRADLHPAQLPPRAHGRLVLRELPGRPDRGAGEAAGEDRRGGREGGEGRSPSATSPSRSSGRTPPPSGRASSSRLKTACGHAQGAGAGAVRHPARQPASGGAAGPDLADVARGGGRPRRPGPLRDPRLPLGRPVAGRPFLPGPSPGGLPPPPPATARTTSSSRRRPPRVAGPAGAGPAAAAGRRRRSELREPGSAAPPAGWDASLAAFLRSGTDGGMKVRGVTPMSVERRDP